MNKRMVSGLVLLLHSIGLFFLQIGYLFLHSRYQLEYIDDRLFYLIPILCSVGIWGAILFLLKTTTKRAKITVSSFIGLFMIMNGVHLFSVPEKSIVSLSPNFKHIFLIKENKRNGEAIYYRTFYGIFARQKEHLPEPSQGKCKVEWLANDVADITYQAKNQKLQSFVGTYGDRNDGISYYYVGAEIHGQWGAPNTEVISNTEGITVIQNGQKELFVWGNIQQYGTLAIVLMKNNESVWTISLNDNFQMDPEKSTGDITLYKTTINKNKPIVLSEN